MSRTLGVLLALGTVALSACPARTPTPERASPTPVDLEWPDAAPPPGPSEATPADAGVVTVDPP